MFDLSASLTATVSRYVKYQWFRSYATASALAFAPAPVSAAAAAPSATGPHVTQKLMSDGSHHRFPALYHLRHIIHMYNPCLIPPFCSAADVSGASGEISGDDDDGDDDIVAMPLPENSPNPLPAAIVSPTSPMEPRQAVFPSALAMSLSPADPTASPTPASQWLDIPNANQPVYTTTIFDVGCVIGVRVWLDWASSVTCTALSDRPVYHPPAVTLLDVQVRARVSVVVVFWGA
jgi:hypothetical protein